MVGVFHQQSMLHQLNYHLICRRRVSHTLGHIYLDGQWQILPQIWGYITYNKIFHETMVLLYTIQYNVRQQRIYIVTWFLSSAINNMMRHHISDKKWKGFHQHCFINWQVTLFLNDCNEYKCLLPHHNQIWIYLWTRKRP